MKKIRNGCLTALLILVVGVVLLFNAFKASPADRAYGNREFHRLLTDVGLRPNSVTTDGRYMYEGGGLTFEVYFSEKMLQQHPVLKESPIRHGNRLDFYVLTVEDINYYEVGENLFNPALQQFLEEKSREYLRGITQNMDESYSVFQWDTKEECEKGIFYYEQALSMVRLKKNKGAIDTVIVKQGKEEQVEELVRKMDAAGLLTVTKNETVVLE